MYIYLLALVCGVELWVCHFPIGILGQVWYLIVSIPDLCTLTYLCANAICTKVLYDCPCSLVETTSSYVWLSNPHIFLFLSAGKQFRAIIGIVFRWWADRGYM